MEQERVINVGQITKEVTDKIIASWKELEKSSHPPLAIFLAGFQGSGKSTIANSLQHKFGFTVVSLDDVRNLLF